VTLEKLSNMITNYRFCCVSEKDLQDGIAAVLLKENIPCLRECTLSAPDRPDFMLEGGIALEIKIKGSLAELIRQASRYAEHEEVTGILVVGTPHWFPRIPATLGGKPVRALRLIGSLL
jgi:hypothetical protein